MSDPLRHTDEGKTEADYREGFWMAYDQRINAPARPARSARGRTREDDLMTDAEHLVQFSDGDEYECPCPQTENHGPSDESLLAQDIESILCGHLTKMPNERGWVACECGEKYPWSYNTHLTKVLTTAIQERESAANE